MGIYERLNEARRGGSGRTGAPVLEGPENPAGSVRRRLENARLDAQPRAEAQTTAEHDQQSGYRRTQALKAGMDLHRVYRDQARGYSLTQRIKNAQYLSQPDNARGYAQTQKIRQAQQQAALETARQDQARGKRRTAKEFSRQIDELETQIYDAQLDQMRYQQKVDAGQAPDITSMQEARKRLKKQLSEVNRELGVKGKGAFWGDALSALVEGADAQAMSGWNEAGAYIEAGMNRAAAWALRDLARPLPQGKLKSGMLELADRMAVDVDMSGAQAWQEEYERIMQEATAGHSGAAKWILEQLPSAGAMVLDQGMAGYLGAGTGTGMALAGGQSAGSVLKSGTVGQRLAQGVSDAVARLGTAAGGARVSPLALMGVRAGGNAALEAKNNGATDAQALAYGVAAGGLEVFSEKLFGGNPVYDQDAGLVNKLAGKLTSNKTILKILDSKAFDFASEGLEEIVTEVLDPVAEWAIYNGENTEFADAASIGNAFLGGVFLSALGNVVDAPNQIRQARSDKAMRAVSQALVEQAQALGGENAQAAAQAVQEKLDYGRTPDVADVGSILDAMSRDGAEADVQAAASAVQSSEVLQPSADEKAQSQRAGNEKTDEVRDLPVQYSVGTMESAEQHYRGVDLSKDGSIYTYDFLTSLPDMDVTMLPEISDIRNADNRVDPAKIVQEGMKNARAVGIERNGKVFVRNRYTGRLLRVDTSSVRHGLYGEANRLLTNARLGVVIGDIVKNAVPVNALKNEAKNAIGTYAMAAYAKDTAGRQFSVIVTVEQRTDAVAGVEIYDVTHAVSGRQKRSERVGTKPQGVYPSTNASFKIRVADFLKIVNVVHQSVLSQNVMDHFGETKNPGGYYTNRVKFSVGAEQVKGTAGTVRITGNGGPNNHYFQTGKEQAYGRAGGTDFAAQRRRGAGMDSGGTALDVADGAERTQALQRQQAERQQRAAQEAGLRAAGSPLQSGWEIGLRYGSEEKCFRTLPEELYTPRQREVCGMLRQAGFREIHLIYGPIGIRDRSSGRTLYADGVSRGTEVYIRVDAKQSMQALAEHETFHRLLRQNAALLAQGKQALAENLGPEELEILLHRYAELYEGCYDAADLEAILEEVLADAYAGISRRGLNADAYQQAVRTAAKQTAGGGSAAQKADGTRGPPERYSINNTRNDSVKEQFKKYRADALSSHDEFYFGTMPSAYSALGVEGQSIVLAQTAYQKSKNGKHNVPQRIFNNLEDIIQRPVLSFELGDAVGILTGEVDGDGKPLLIGALKNTNLDGETVTRIKSIYGLDNPREWLANQIKAGKSLRIYNEKADSFLNGIGYKAERTESYRFGDIVADVKANVNEKLSVTEAVTGALAMDRVQQRIGQMRQEANLPKTGSTNSDTAAEQPRAIINSASTGLATEKSMEGGIENGRTQSGDAVLRSLGLVAGIRGGDSGVSEVGRISETDRAETGLGLYGGGSEPGIHLADSEGRRIRADQAKQIRDTTATDGAGRPLALYHFTPELEFTVFDRGDTGFHFGSWEQAQGGQALQSGNAAAAAAQIALPSSKAKRLAVVSAYISGENKEHPQASAEPV